MVQGIPDVPHRGLGVEPHAGDGVVAMAADDAAGGEEHNVVDAGVVEASHQLGHCGEPAEQEDLADAGERGGEASRAR